MSKRLFIIEDDANILYSLLAKFRVNNFDVEMENGSKQVYEILKKIKKFKPDYIISDLILPKIDGFELLRLIKSDSEINRVPVFVFTNLSDNDSKARSEMLGADFYFIKNELNIDAFVSKILKIIDKKENRKI